MELSTTLRDDGPTELVHVPIDRSNDMTETKRVCPLCQKRTHVFESHIVPSFVGRYLKRTSVTGKLRMVGEPNRRIQDLTKEFLFCASCEELMAEEENHFAQTLFYPLHEQGQTIFSYDHHLGRYCAVQSFRVLVYQRHILDEVKNLKPYYAKVAEKATELLRAFLLSGGKKQNEFSNHIFFFDVVDSLGAQLPKSPNRLNWYFLRAVDMDLVRGNRVLFVYTKMCRIAVMTFLVPKKPKSLEGTRVHTWGTLKILQGIRFPGFGEFLFDRAEGLSSVDRNLSERQKTAIAQGYARTKFRTASTEPLRALEADRRLRILEGIRQSSTISPTPASRSCSSPTGKQRRVKNTHLEQRF